MCQIWVRYGSKKALKHITSEIIFGFSIFIYFHFEGFANISHADIPVARREDENLKKIERIPDFEIVFDYKSFRYFFAGKFFHIY